MQAKSKITKRIELALDMDEDEALTLRHILEYGQTMIPHTGETPSQVINTILTALRNAKGDNLNEKAHCRCHADGATFNPKWDVQGASPLNGLPPIDPLFD